MNPRSAAQTGFPVMLFIGVLLVATNLRAPFTGVAPLMSDIQQALQVTSSTAGLLITLPLIIFMLVSPLVPRLSRRLGMERTMLLSLIVIALGIGVRSLGGLAPLFGGTVLIGAGIAAGNVLLPGVVKLRFPNHIALLTSAYVLAMGVMAAAWSALVIPLAAEDGWGGWQFSLMAMIIMPVASALLWLKQIPRKKQQAPEQGSSQGAGPIFKALLTWQICGFFGCNAFLYYAVVSWLPGIVSESGFSASQAGSIHGVMQLASALPGFVIVPAMARFDDQRGISFTMTCVNLAGFIGIMLAPSLAYVWAALLGFGIGANFILALSFIGLRTRDSDQAASMSSAAQTTGYCVAAIGPFLLGAIYDYTGGWSRALGLCVVISLAQALLGTRVGRNVLLPELRPAGTQPVAQSSSETADS